MLRFRPDIVVLSEHHQGYFYKCIPDALIIMTRHGFVSKRYIAKAIRWFDIFCVSSRWVLDEYVKKGWRPRIGYFASGFTPMDEVFRSLQSPDDSPAKKLFPDKGPVLLYAPTWNSTFNSAEVLGKGWGEMLRKTHPDLNILIKPHPHALEENGEWMTVWRNMASRDPKIHLIEDTHSDIYQYFAGSDILMSDASSPMFFFLALDRPIILVNNPRRFTDRTWFDSSAPEWQWRDMGIEIESAAELPGAVTRCLLHPQENAEKRALYRERLFGNLFDGKASERIAQLVRTLLRPDAGNAPWVENAWKIVAKRAEKGQDQKRKQPVWFQQAVTQALKKQGG